MDRCSFSPEPLDFSIMQWLKPTMEKKIKYLMATMMIMMVILQRHVWQYLNNGNNILELTNETIEQNI